MIFLQDFTGVFQTDNAIILNQTASLRRTRRQNAALRKHNSRNSKHRSTKQSQYYSFERNHMLSGSVLPLQTEVTAYMKPLDLFPFIPYALIVS